MYCGPILSRDPTTASGQNFSELDLLVNAFVFVEKVQDAPFMNPVLAEIIMHTNTKDKQGEKWFLTGSTVHRVYEGTPVGSPLRRLMVNMHNCHGIRDWIEGNSNVEFLEDLVRDMFDTRACPRSLNPTRETDNSCLHHLHSNDKFCYPRQS
jgi:hypothetical protein